VEERQYYSSANDAPDGAPGYQKSLSSSLTNAKAKGFEKRRRSPQDEEKEKARLQNLVDTFARKAVRGCLVTHVDERRGDQTACLYRIDKNLRHLTLLSKEDRKVVAECPLKDIQDIYLVEDGEECFPPSVLRQVSGADRGLLLMLVFGSSDANVFSFCMLEESCESRDMFLESMRILSIYASHAPPVDNNNLGIPAASARRN
jgi:hypothetical protein